MIERQADCAQRDRRMDAKLNGTARANELMYVRRISFRLRYNNLRHDSQQRADVFLPLKNVAFQLHWAVGSFAVKRNVR